MKRIFNTTYSKLSKYNGTKVEIIKQVPKHGYDFDEVDSMYKVKFYDGYTTNVFEYELS